MTKTQQITAALASHIMAGKSAREAIEIVFGAGSYDRIAGELYDALNQKAAAKAVKH